MWLQDIMVPRINTGGDCIAGNCPPYHLTSCGKVQFPHAQHHSKQRRRWVGAKFSTRNGRRDPKCPSAGRLRMFREDTGAPTGGATCAWMVADEAVGCTRALLTMWRSSQRLVCRGVLSLVFMQMTFLRSTGFSTSSQHNQSGLTDKLLV
ncbi:uncharacterized protein TNCV_4724431 [Trichonephila clavipes]|uniref:Uncharacterized protein n=1 Tax=Trichonephila clavipes TaxID=2585209 RepID=A0A8X6W6R1_TRICX|nr:uncharacterized protein TNCV_4724431 [Trichonephila clavipes]